MGDDAVTLPDMLTPTYRQMLEALSAWLGKAETQMPAERAQALMSARLAPDMFPLATQVRFACVQAQEGVLRARGQAFRPSIAVLLDEGRDAGERPGSIAEARGRIAGTLAFVKEAAAAAPELDPSASVAHALPQGIVFDLTAEQYARDWALPQFYFHVVIAYAILRAEGVDLGKVDYVAHMLGFVRPGTMG